MDAIARNKAILGKYNQIVTANYKEPSEDGMFDDCIKDVLEELQQEEDSDPDEESDDRSRESFIKYQIRDKDFGHATTMQT